MNRPTPILLAAAVLVLLAGIGLAVVQPGDLGGDDETALQGDQGDAGDGTTSSTTTDDGTPTTADGTTSSTDAPTTSTTGSPTTGTPTTTPGDGTSTTSTTTPVSSSGDGRSGLGSSGAADPSDTSDGLADTGGESLVLLGLGLGVAGVAVRRRVTALGG